MVHVVDVISVYNCDRPDTARANEFSQAQSLMNLIAVRISVISRTCLHDNNNAN